jgi:hypothetical protein
MADPNLVTLFRIHVEPTTFETTIPGRETNRNVSVLCKQVSEVNSHFSCFVFDSLSIAWIQAEHKQYYDSSTIVTSLHLNAPIAVIVNIYPEEVAIVN